MFKKFICGLPFVSHQYTRYEDKEDEMLVDSWGYLYCSRCENCGLMDLTEVSFTTIDSKDN
jgi:hypothetical protein